MPIQSKRRSGVKSSRIPSPARQIRASLDEILRAHRTGDFSRMKVRKVSVPEPRDYDARAVRLLRDRVGVSQWFFAQLLGVSVDLVESWEQGLRKPRPIARRLLDEIARDPKRWRDMIRQSA